MSSAGDSMRQQDRALLINNNTAHCCPAGAGRDNHFPAPRNSSLVPAGPSIVAELHQHGTRLQGIIAVEYQCGWPDSDRLRKLAWKPLDAIGRPRPEVVSRSFSMLAHSTPTRLISATD